MFQTNFQGSKFIQDYLSRVDRATRKSKDETHKKCANLLTASLVTGAHDIEDLMRQDDRVREKWGMGSEEKARALLNVWANSTLFVKCQLNNEFSDDDLAAIGSVLCMFDHWDKAQAETLFKEFWHFAWVFRERPTEGINLKWQTLLCLRTFRALQDDAVPPELDFSTLNPVGTDWAGIFWDQERISPYANEEAFQQFTAITRLGLFGDILGVGLIAHDESYDSLQNRKKSFWSKLRG